MSEFFSLFFSLVRFRSSKLTAGISEFSHYCGTNTGGKLISFSFRAESLDLTESRVLGTALAKLIEYMDEIVQPECTAMIGRLELVAFSNFYFVSSFDLNLWRDYKANKKIARACEEQIKRNHCRRGVSQYRKVRLAQVVLCVDEFLKDHDHLLSDCSLEIAERRRLLIDDYQITPGVLTGCAKEMSKFCGKFHASDGLIIPCLLENARAESEEKRRVTVRCERGKFENF